MTNPNLPAGYRQRLNHLPQLKHVSEVDVYKAGTLAAQLRRTSDGSVEFQYFEKYLNSSHPPVASTLPLQSEPVRNAAGSLPNFFSGLLPEGQRLSILRREIKTSADDELSLLLAVGLDTPGDVQVVPAGEKLTQAPSLIQSTNWSNLDFQELAKSLDLVALPGIQDKVSAAMLSAPIRNQTGAYIIKFTPNEYPLLVENECAHLEAAAQLRIPAAQARIISDRHETPALLIRRFDRLASATGWHLLATEDGTQAMDLPPADKYRVSTEDVALTLMGMCSAPIVAAQVLYLQFLFAWLTGNGDLHAKNVSVLQNKQGQYHIAPIYDVSNTLVYRDLSMALSVDGRTTGLRKRHWDTLGDTLGLPIKAVQHLQQRALRAAQAVDLPGIGFSGSPLYGAQRELRFRRAELKDSP